jgi:hypothetical protein
MALLVLVSEAPRLGARQLLIGIKPSQLPTLV